MKRLFVTFVSCLVLLSATVTTPALAEVKDEAKQSDVSAFQAALTTASDGIQSVLDGVKTNIAELFGTNEQIALDNSESAQASEPGALQDTESATAIPSNLTGVVWSADYKTCTLQSGYSVDGQDLRSEIASHKNNLTTFKAEDSTSLTGNAANLFYDCASLATVDLAPSFDTSAVTSMNSMFFYCSSLTSLALPDAFNTGAVQNMEAMFYNCSSLTSLELPDAFNTGVVRDMSHMFLGCTQLEEINMSMFSSENLTDCSLMFANCNSLKELDLGYLVPPAGQGSFGMFLAIDSDTGEILGNIPNIEKITMSGSCILAPGEGTTPDTASGTFFDYKEPLSWNAYYLGTTAEGQPSNSSTQGNLSAEPDAVLTGFDEFKAYQETHPGLTTYMLDRQPTPPGPTPDPTPEPTPDAMPASDTDVLPVTGDTFAALASAVVAVLMGTLALLASVYGLTRNRLQ